MLSCKEAPGCRLGVEATEVAPGTRYQGVAPKVSNAVPPPDHGSHGDLVGCSLWPPKGGQLEGRRRRCGDTSVSLLSPQYHTRRLGA